MFCAIIVSLRNTQEPDREILSGFLCCRKRWFWYGKKGFAYKSQYAVIVICSGEEDQKHTYEKLLADGYKLKVVAV